MLIGGGVLTVIAIVYVLTSATERTDASQKYGDVRIVEGAMSAGPFSDGKRGDPASAIVPSAFPPQAANAPTGSDVENAGAQAQLDPELVKRDLQFAPYLENGAVKGLSLPSLSASGPLAAIGLRQGDVIVELDGEPIRSIGDAEILRNQVYPGGLVSFVVLRDMRRVNLSMAFEN